MFRWTDKRCTSVMQYTTISPERWHACLESAQFPSHGMHKLNCIGSIKCSKAFPLNFSMCIFISISIFLKHTYYAGKSKYYWIRLFLCASLFFLASDTTCSLLVRHEWPLWMPFSPSPSSQLPFHTSHLLISNLLLLTTAPSANTDKAIQTRWKPPPPQIFQRSTLYLKLWTVWHFFFCYCYICVVFGIFVCLENANCKIGFVTGRQWLLSPELDVCVFVWVFTSPRAIWGNVIVFNMPHTYPWAKNTSTLLLTWLFVTINNANHIYLAPKKMCWTEIIAEQHFVESLAQNCLSQISAEILLF